VLIDDHFEFKETTYYGLPGVVHKENKKEFISTLKRFVSDNSFMNKAKLEQKKISSQYGILDGNAKKRIINEILQSKKI